MNNKRTITTREQFKINGKFVREQQPILLPVLMGTKPFA